MSVWACACTTPAAETARSRLLLCALTMNSDSSGLPNCCHQSAFGHTDCRPVSCPTKDCGISCGLSTCGTWVAQPTNSAEQAATSVLLITQRADRSRASDAQGGGGDREP